MKRVIVIGGGAAGMMAAVSAADAGGKVCLLEKNEKLGKKIYITGKGRCNVTNAGEKEVFFSNVMSNPKFLYSSFHEFDNRAMMKFLEEAGCRLKVERGDRVFPVSDHSSDVIAALTREIQRRKIEVKLHAQAKDLLIQDGRIAGILLTNGDRLYADSVIVATGGLSYAATGSTGDGYRFAQQAGHGLTEPFPSLVPFLISESFCGALMGLSLKNVSVSLIFEQREIYSGFGEMLFTHFGVSGPLILSASSYYVQALRRWKEAPGRRKDALPVEKGEKNPEVPDALLYIDLKPALSEEQLERRILRDFEENKKKQFKNAVNRLFPIRLIPVMISLSGIYPDRKVSEITKEERRRLVAITKKLPLTILGVGDYNEAVITKGGITVKEVNPSTMESKKVKGLYFAGEVLDLDALTGGFNLQIAWSTGYLAGKSAGLESGEEETNGL